MTDSRPPRTSDEATDQPRPGSDPGEAYDRAVADETTAAENDEEHGPDVGDVYRSGS